jgi:hypothetical protein
MPKYKTLNDKFLQRDVRFGYSQEWKIVLNSAKKLVDPPVLPVIPAKYAWRVLPDDRSVLLDRFPYLARRTLTAYP